MEESLAEIKEQEEEMSRASRALTIRLEDVQVRMSNTAIQWSNVDPCRKHSLTSLMFCHFIEELDQTDQ